MHLSAQDWLKKIRQLPLPDKVRIMNVCGGHERAITMAGLRSALPKNIELIPGPGCPVCVCPEEDVYEAMQLAIRGGVILVAFGDMLRVPVNVPKGEVRSLEETKAAGADVRPIASPVEAVRIARDNPSRTVVFFAAGFETTTAPVAGMLQEGVPDNLLVLLSGRLTWPAVAMLLDSDTPGDAQGCASAAGDRRSGAAFDILIAPGHVATIMGPEEWRFVIEKHGIPAAIAGFAPETLLAAMYSGLRQLIEGECFLDNCYPEVVRPGGNTTARRCIAAVMDVVDANWRGVGTIPNSGFALKPAYAAQDARLRLPTQADPTRKRIGEMPPGCDCAKVVLGRIYPDQCRLFGRACQPRHPIGPCMVSDEGACRIWWAGGVREARSDAVPAG